RAAGLRADATPTAGMASRPDRSAPPAVLGRRAVDRAHQRVTSVIPQPRDPRPPYARSMADQTPTRTAVEERGTLHALLQYCRDSFVRKLDGIDDTDATRRLL